MGAMWMKILLVGLGGSAGAIARFLLSGAVYQLSGNHWFPFGALLVNLVGCLAIGLIMGLIQERELLSPELSLFLLVGVLGSFTTFSTFGFESIELFKESHPTMGLLNIGAHVFLGLLGVWAGLTLARAL